MCFPVSCRTPRLNQEWRRGRDGGRESTNLSRALALPAQGDAGKLAWSTMAAENAKVTSPTPSPRAQPAPLLPRAFSAPGLERHLTHRTHVA